jgi:SAM-dependent methyltransferase
MHPLGKLFRLFVNSQIKLSNWFDSLLPAKYSIDGYVNFSTTILPGYIRENSVIYDIGGGKNPYLTNEMKSRIRCKVVGLDIDENELNAAPHAAYDKTIAADITEYKGNEDGDLVICMTLLEHVKDVEMALVGIRSCLKIGGICALFVPSKNAMFTRINRILPEKFKRQILFLLFPNAKKCQGFPAYYNRCTPSDINDIAQSLGFEILDERYYYISTYFSFFFPLYILWRIYLLGFHWIAKEQAAETFGFVLKKAKL